MEKEQVQNRASQSTVTTSADGSRRRKRLNIKEGITKLPDKKPHLDFIVAVLTIPLLAITLYLNITNIRSKNTISHTPTPIQTNVNYHQAAPSSTITKI